MLLARHAHRRLALSSSVPSFSIRSILVNTVPRFNQSHNSDITHIAATNTAANAATGNGHHNEPEGLRLLFEPDIKKLSFRTWRQKRWHLKQKECQSKVDIMLEGQPLRGVMSSSKFDTLLQQIGQDAGAVMKRALDMKVMKQKGYQLPRTAVLSLVVCDDAHISRLNSQHRGKDGPTDVLSFEMDDDLDMKVRLPVKLVGDMVVSLDTALRQAKERGHTLLDEVRILLVHGMLHLMGYDHETGHQDLLDMAAAEQQIMKEFGWVGQGLIAAVGADQAEDMHDNIAPPPAPKGFGGHKPKQASAASGSSQKKQRNKDAAVRAATATATASGSSSSVLDMAAASGGGSTAGSGSAFRKRPVQRAPTLAGQAAAATGTSGGASLGVLGVVFGSSAPSEDAPSSSGNTGSDRLDSSQHASTSAAAVSSSSASAPRRRFSTSSSAVRSMRLTHATSSSLLCPSRKVVMRALPDRDLNGPLSPSSLVAENTLSVSPSKRRQRKVDLVALDMDGTLLDSRSQIRPQSVKVIKAALQEGVNVILATGKARPAAISACQRAGLAGPGLLVHSSSPGIFLQGLAVHGRGGQQLADSQLPTDVVRQTFSWVEEQYPNGEVTLVAFNGDHCTTLRMTDNAKALHEVYYEPLAEVCSNIDELLSGAPVRKLLFMTDPEIVDGVLKPYWGNALPGSGASSMQAVKTMLEIVPDGVDKWAGAQLLLQHLDIQNERFMAVGDGGNDLQLVANAGIGVAMGNAVRAVKEAATVVVSSHDDDGIAEAFESYVL